jgi:membrane protease YdiL (CAAX protease family)
MRHFLTFLCYPYAPADRSVRWGKKMRISLVVLVVMFMVNITVGLLHTLLVSRGLIADAIGGFEKPAYIREMPGYAVFLEFVVLTPLLEELAFRGLLQRSSIYIRASLAVNLYILVCTLFGLNFYRMDWWTLLVTICSGMFFFLTRAYLERIKHFCMLGKCG